MSASQRDSTGVESIGEFIHKESSKENKRSKGSKALSLKVQGSTAVKSRFSVDKGKKESTVKRVMEAQKLTLRSANAEHNARIDEILLGFLMEDLIDEAYWSYHTKCMYTLGIERYVMLVNAARSGRNPKHLLAYKLKSSMEFEAKKQEFRDKYELQ